MYQRWFHFIFIIGFVLCSQWASAYIEPKPGFTKYYKSSFTKYLEHANRTEPPQSDGLTLQAVGRLLQDNQLEQADQLLHSMHFQTLSRPLQHEFLILQANLTLLKNEPYRCLNTLHQIENPDNLLLPQRIAYYHLLAMANVQIKNFLVSAEARMALDAQLKNTTSQRHNREQIWHALNQLSVNELAAQVRRSKYGDLQGWVEIVYIYKMYHDEPAILDGERQQWQQRYTRHPANSLLPSQHATLRNFFNATNRVSMPMVSANRGNEPLHIALLLPTSGPHASAGEAVKNGFMAGYYENQQANNAPAEIDVYDTVGQNVQTVYKQAIQQGANVIVGPLTKASLRKIEAMGSLPVPTLGLNFTPNGGKGVANFFEYALSPQDEAKQVAKKMLADSREQVLMIVPEGSWGQHIADAFRQTFTRNGGHIADSTTYKRGSSLDLTVKKLLQLDDKLFSKFRQGNEEEDSSLPRRTDFDAIFMVADPVTARQIKPLLQFYFAGDIPVYATSEVYAGKPNPNLDRDLNGIIFCDIPFSINTGQNVVRAHQQMQQLAPNLAANKTRLYAFGRDAYQIAVLLNPFHLSKHHRIKGLTGDLYLDNQQILRRLQWAEFKNGAPKHING